MTGLFSITWPRARWYSKSTALTNISAGMKIGSARGPRKLKKKKKKKGNRGEAKSAPPRGGGGGGGGAVHNYLSHAPVWKSFCRVGTAHHLQERVVDISVGGAHPTRLRCHCEGLYPEVGGQHFEPLLYNHGITSRSLQGGVIRKGRIG